MPARRDSTQEEIYRRIRRRLTAVRKTELSAATEAGLGRDAIRDIRRKPKTVPSITTLERLAPVLGTTPWWLAFGHGSETSPGQDDAEWRVVPVVGYVGAGAAAHYYAVSQGGLDDAPAPDDSTDRTVAVEIRGDSLGPLFDRWLAFYDDLHNPVGPETIGQLCIVGVTEDRVLIKRVRKGRGNTYDLISVSSETDEVGVEIAWAARIKSMSPAR